MIKSEDIIPKDLIDSIGSARAIIEEIKHLEAQLNVHLKKIGVSEIKLTIEK